MNRPMETESDTSRADAAVTEAATSVGVVRVGDHVRLAPRGSADIFDLALRGCSAVVESIEKDLEDQIYLAVVVDEDPGREFGQLRKPAHRFFFRPDEVQLLDGADRGRP